MQKIDIPPIITGNRVVFAISSTQQWYLWETTRNEAYLQLIIHSTLESFICSNLCSFHIGWERDSLYIHLYGINDATAEYTLETILIIKCKDIICFGRRRIKKPILEIYDAMQRAKDTGQPYQTILDPPPADPRVAHLFKE